MKNPQLALAASVALSAFWMDACPASFAADTNQASQAAASVPGNSANPLSLAGEGEHDPDKEGHEVHINNAKILATKKQLQAAAADASKINEHDPAVTPDIPTHEEVRRPTIALALGGGGARGAAHIGVLKVLKENGIPVDYIVGNSMGSIVGGLYSAGVPLPEIQTMLSDKSLRKAYMGHLPPKILLAPVAKLTHPFGGGKYYAGLWTGDKFEKFIDSKLPKSGMLISETKIPFSTVATNLLDGQAYRISDGPLSRAIRASSSISPIIKPIMIDGKLYCDGGVRANLPASAARETGADVVIAVLVDEPLQTVPPKQFKHLAGVASRLADIILAVSDERQLQFSDVVINPDVSGVPVLSNDGRDADKAELAGEIATRKALPVILKKLEEKRRRQDGTVAATTQTPH